MLSALGSGVTLAPSRPVVIAVRFGVLGFSALLAGLAGQFGALAVPLAMLIALAAVTTVPLSSGPLRIIRPLGEAGVAALILGSVDVSPEVLLPYLVVPPLAAGVEAGFAMAAASVAVSAVVLAAAEWLVVGSADPGIYRYLAEWVCLGLVTGAVGAWARSQQLMPDETADTYVAAHTLLSQLREVARALPTGLDEVSLAQSMLSDMRAAAPYDRAALYTLSDLDRLLPLTLSGAERLDWDLDADDGLWARVHSKGTFSSRSGSFSDPGLGSSAMLPLRLGDRIIGVVAIERDGDIWHRASLDAAQTVMDNAALQLDTGRLFSEVRALATMEERRRLAREIHDGIAQEVASLGYVVDDIAASEDDTRQRARILELRNELSRIVSELRFSIFDLRSDVQPHTGLGAALSSYVRQVGTSSGLTIHLVLDESSQRLGAETETELLRIAQEAVTNARRHARARNLWVTCRVNPPHAFLRVADDGTGLGSPRIDSYGLDIMRERAGRLGVRLSVRERVGGGTVVEIALGAAAIGSARRTHR